MGSIAAEDSLSPESNGGRERIRVSVRLRPLNEDELSRNDPSEWDCISHTTIAFKNTANAYTFDRVFSSESTTREVYEGGAKDVVMSVVRGINASIFAYGQTSSGKTYTMTGITEMAAADIFDYIEQHEEREFVLKFSAMEIYNESVRDLLSTDSTPLRLLDGPDRSTIVEKLTEEVVRDWEHIMQLLSICEAQREIGETLLNKTSSRSHQIIRLTIESSAREFVNAESSRGLVASVHFVDLAGSERASQAMSAGARLKEGCHINRSLLTLGTVIRKLSKDHVGHIPYRDSKLTRILQQSLGGNARTAIICTMSPARTHMEQSRNTLMFATCAKEVVTRAQVNVVMSDKAMVKHLQRELARLESQLRLPRGDYANELLREREDRIQQMAIDIMEITRQRDVARAQLDDLMRTVGDDQESVHRMEIDIREITRQRDLARAQLDDLMRTAGDDQESVHRFGIFRASASDLPSINGDDFSVDNSSDLLYSIGNNNQRSPEISTGHYPNSAESVSSERRDLLSLEVGQEMEDLCKEVQCVAVEETMEVRKGRREWELMERAGSSSSETSGRLGRSRSCKASFMERSPGLFEEERERTPPGSGFMGEYGRSSRPEDVRRRLFSLRAEVSGEVSSPSASCGFEDRQAQSPARRVEDTSEDDAQEADEKFSRSVTSRSIKDMGVDPIMITPAESPARWPDEFERRRLEIIELWHLCNISVVHRTYFFLLCLSNPGDPIYLELELRRLRFIKRALSGSNGTKISPSSNVKALRRERGMLCRQMQRRLSAVEREMLYRQWGIPLQTKQRKLQLAHLVWTAAGSISHAAESAAVVAKVVGQPNDTHKEMLILSFSLAQSKKTKLSI